MFQKIKKFLFENLCDLFAFNWECGHIFNWKNIFVKWSNKRIVVNVEVFYIGMRVGFAMIVS
jgi:hypothetical protein